jgi:hypothetical protein
VRLDERVRAEHLADFAIEMAATAQVCSGVASLRIVYSPTMLTLATCRFSLIAPLESRDCST